MLVCCSMRKRGKGFGLMGLLERRRACKEGTIRREGGASEGTEVVERRKEEGKEDKWYLRLH